MSINFINQFIGFFLGEGYGGIVRYKRSNQVCKRGYFFRPQMCITQRYDNLQSLQQIQKFFGGHIYQRRAHFPSSGKYQTKESFIWITTNIETIDKLCDYILNSELQHKKLDSIKLLKEFTSWKINRGISKHYTKKDIIRIQDLANRIKKNNQFGLSMNK